MLNVELTVEVTGTSDAFGIVRDVLEDAAHHLDQLQGGDVGVTVLLAQDDVISRLHEEFFGDASLTDVMSFPANDMDAGDGDYLGDIAISLTVAEFQAREHNHSTVREVAFLALHGLLHLLGLDDHDPAERDAMLQKQTELLETFERRHGAL